MQRNTKWDNQNKESTGAIPIYERNYTFNVF